MACNAWNHPDDCQCQFRGGHANSTPPKRAKWTAKSYSAYIRQAHQICEKCGAIVFFIKFKNGGGGFFDRLGRPWVRHGCLKKHDVYDPFTKRRVPKLKLVKSDYERNGWSPIFDISVMIDMFETVITGVSLDAHGALKFATDARPQVDTTVLTYYRDDPNKTGDVEIDYFDELTQIPKTIFARRLN